MAKKKTKLRKRTFLVYMHNCVDFEDDEVYKVKATSVENAKTVAYHAQDWGGRFTVGWAMPYYPRSKADKKFLKSYRWWATDKTDVLCDEFEMELE